MKELTHVVSFSGGRTSAYLVHLMEIARKKLGWRVKYIFCDTGVEHPQTYVFIRNIVKFWGVDLIILRADVNPSLGQGNGYIQYEPKDLMNSEVMPPLEPFFSMMKKYGTPNAFGAYCSERMKKDVADKYCKEHYGKKFVTWLGMRSDEPKRLKPKPGIKYLADLVEVDKQDINDWWSRQLFDLQLEEQEGNCLFCIKKSTAKIALAAKQNPGHLQLWKHIINSKEVREKEGFDKRIMYRGKLSLDGISQLYADKSESEIRINMRSSKRFETGNCAESCEGLKLEGKEINYEIVNDDLYIEFEDQLSQFELAI
ncbi:phosphoadenosine phosphosulfate reductase domain-containing protein [Photobacterium angustum]|uniref:Phosphoadenosine phosphosulphate reductase domain-containing protein n=1 Tax=Photobacterium angustum TaxID=661 RepID=A0ABX5GYH9_PHOAN|nr:phosphoadenosine phosphosulfate reductase family protein [Photobacterium angustum]PSX01650.1 hypothetical protein C0W27_21930 [Photobacterium angustum]